MAKLFLLRHLKSQWNEDDRFAGWTDGPLAKGDLKYAEGLAKEIFQDKIDVVYTSPLFRNMDTVAELFEWVAEKYPFFIHLDPGKMKEWGRFVDISENDVSTFISENLSERYYGKSLQGMNKAEITEKYGEEKVRLWRRGYDAAPPGGESLKDVYKRAVPFFKKYAERDLKDGKNVLVVASHNSLRTVVKYVENISDDKIIDLELPFGSLVKYDFAGGAYKKLQ
jgi:2,3-bisphosphoglycerate-dependent phosphoglycerate mutase